MHLQQKWYSVVCSAAMAEPQKVQNLVYFGFPRTNGESASGAIELVESLSCPLHIHVCVANTFHKKIRFQTKCTASCPTCTTTRSPHSGSETKLYLRCLCDQLNLKSPQVPQPPNNDDLPFWRSWTTVAFHQHQKSPSSTMKTLSHRKQEVDLGKKCTIYKLLVPYMYRMANNLLHVHWLLQILH